MTVTAQSHYRGFVRVSRETFSRVLRERANPEVIAERDPGEYWDACVARDCDPLYLLAMFGKESTFGRFGVAATSKSWGNTRAPNFGATPIGVMPGQSGEFPVWASWMDGMVSTVSRLMAPDWYYAGEQRTIGEVNHDPHWDHVTNRSRLNPAKPARPPIPRRGPLEWAPAGDMNSPTGYLHFILTFMNAHQDIERTTNITDIHGVPFRRAHIPAGNSNRPGGSYRKTHATWHETGNTTIGANAEMHARFVHGTNGRGGGVDNVSFGYVVDDTEIIELLPFQTIDGQTFGERSWHAGDGGTGHGNTHSIGIELCVNADGDWTKTLENGARLGAWLHQEQNVQHNHWSGKNCPQRLRAAGWGQFLERIAVIREHGLGAPVTPIREFPKTGMILGGGFKDYYEWLESRIGLRETMLLVGYPLTNEIEEDGKTVQYFERARFEWHPGDRPDRFDVLLGRTSAELLEARAEICQLRERIAELEGQIPPP